MTVSVFIASSVPKYYEGAMEELGLALPKTLVLDVLLKALQIRHPTLRPSRRGLLFLSVFAVDTRYPGNNASKRQAVAALRWAARVRKPVRTLLGIRERPPKGM